MKKLLNHFFPEVKYIPEWYYLFNWEDISEKNSKQLRDYLVKTLGIYLGGNTVSEKNDAGKTITVTNNGNSLELELNEEEDKVILKINGEETYEYLVKKENGKLSIYSECKDFESKENLDDSLREILEKKGCKFDFVMCCKFVSEFYGSYLFSWNDVLKNDSWRLRDHLVKTLGLDWVKVAEIKKNDTDKTITVASDRNSLELKLNEKDDKVILINDGVIYEYLVKKDNKDKLKLNIYDENNQKYKKNKGMYKTITETVSNLMEKEGLFILLDTTNSINNDVNFLMPKLMSKEIIEYSRCKNAKLKLIMPLSCAFWYDRCEEYNKNVFNCFTRKKFNVIHRENKDKKDGEKETKVTYKIFAFKENADEILSKIEKQEKGYNLAIGECKTCKKGQYEPKDLSYGEYKDTFSFKDNLKSNINDKPIEDKPVDDKPIDIGLLYLDSIPLTILKCVKDLNEELTKPLVAAILSGEEWQSISDYDESKYFDVFHGKYNNLNNDYIKKLIEKEFLELGKEKKLKISKKGEDAILSGNNIELDIIKALNSKIIKE